MEGPGPRFLTASSTCSTSLFGSPSLYCEGSYRLLCLYQPFLQEDPRESKNCTLVYLTPVLICSDGENTGLAEVVVNDLQLDGVPQAPPRAREHTINKPIPELRK